MFIFICTCIHLRTYIFWYMYSKYIHTCSGVARKSYAREMIYKIIYKVACFHSGDPHAAHIHMFIFI